MKRFVLIVLLAISASFTFSQTSTLPAATATQVTVPWVLPSNCSATNTCQFTVYKISGTCPATLAGSAGWTLAGTTAAQATQFIDTTVTAGAQYSYDVEAEPVGSTTDFSGPSNCQTTTVPFTPTPPVVGTLVAI